MHEGPTGREGSLFSRPVLSNPMRLIHLFVRPRPLCRPPLDQLSPRMSRHSLCGRDTVCPSAYSVRSPIDLHVHNIHCRCTLVRSEAPPRKLLMATVNRLSSLQRQSTRPLPSPPRWTYCSGVESASYPLPEDTRNQLLHPWSGQWFSK